jgi:hypothetical protein
MSSEFYSNGRNINLNACLPACPLATQSQMVAVAVSQQLDKG